MAISKELVKEDTRRVVPGSRHWKRPEPGMSPPIE